MTLWLRTQAKRQNLHETHVLYAHALLNASVHVTRLCAIKCSSQPQREHSAVTVLTLGDLPNKKARAILKRAPPNPQASTTQAATLAH